MKKNNFFLFLVLTGFATVLLTTSCTKKCNECPSGYYLAVDKPEDDNCYCCPDGTTYNSETGYCEY